MAITFAVIYPLGALILPLLHRWVLHALVELVAFLAMWAAFALGYLDNERDMWSQTHILLGTVVCALLGVQVVLGYVHHVFYKRHGRRGVWASATYGSGVH